MTKSSDGKKLHVLSEIKDGDVVLVAFKYYDKSKRQWFYDLKPKSEL